MKVENFSFNNNFKIDMSSYNSVIARFEEILRDKLNIPLNQKNDKISKNIDNIDNQIFTKYIKSLKQNDKIKNMSAKMNSGDSISNINDFFKNTPLQNMGEIFKEAEKKYNVNAYVLAAIAVLESDFGRSHIAKEKNNLFGFNANDKSPYIMARRFETKDAGVFKVAEHLSKNYLEKNGKYFNGYDIEAIGKKYASDPQWADKVSKIINKMIK